jgi:hypothetical protein
MLKYDIMDLAYTCIYQTIRDHILAECNQIFITVWTSNLTPEMKFLQCITLYLPVLRYLMAHAHDTNSWVMHFLILIM